MYVYSMYMFSVKITIPLTTTRKKAESSDEDSYFIIIIIIISFTVTSTLNSEKPWMTSGKLSNQAV